MFSATALGHVAFCIFSIIRSDYSVRSPTQALRVLCILQVMSGTAFQVETILDGGGSSPMHFAFLFACMLDSLALLVFLVTVLDRDYVA